MKNKRKKENFIKVKTSKSRPWVTDIYYGLEGFRNHAHLSMSGAILLGDCFIFDKCGEILYQKNLAGYVLINKPNKDRNVFGKKNG